MVLVPTLLVVALRWLNPVTSAFMLQQNLAALVSEDQPGVEYQWIDWKDIAPAMAVAAMASEDQKFPNHFGFDFSELGKAITASSGKKRGASTITQQVAKNLFLWPGRSYLRKALEAGLAILLEVFLSKQRILEIYVNIAQMGPNVYGVGAASRIYFNKSAARLNRFEAARFAAVLPNPAKYSVKNPSAYIIKRQQWILKQMKQLGGNALLDQL